MILSALIHIGNAGYIYLLFSICGFLNSMFDIMYILLLQRERRRAEREATLAKEGLMN